MASNSWNKHVSSHMKTAMKQAMSRAKKTWRGKKKLTAAQEKRVKSLQAQRDKINATIRKIKGR